MKTAKLRKLPCKPTSKEYFIFIGVLLIGLAIFFSSCLFLPGKSNIKVSKIGSSVSVATNVSLSLVSEAVNPNTRYVEAMFAIDAPLSSVQQDFSATVHSDANKSKEIHAEVVRSGLQTIIVQIFDLPSKTKTISVRPTFSTEVSLSSSSGQGLSAESSAAQTNSNAVFYLSIADMQKDDTLTTKTSAEYQMESVAYETDVTNEAISDLQKENEANSQKIASLQSEIQTLEGETPYQTDEELKETQNTISSKNQQIASLQKEIAKNEKSIDQYQVKLEKLQQRQQTLQDSI